MATSLRLQFFILTSIFLSTSAVISSPSPSPQPLFQDHAANPSFLFGPVLASLGFHGFSAAASSLSNITTWRGPITIFAPTDSSLHTCITCSVPLLLQEHILPGLFPLQYLRTLTFGTKIETLAPGRCITVTSSNNSDVFIGGVMVTRPDLYNDGLVAVHGLQGYISHLSPFSCDVQRMTSLSFPHPQHDATPSFLMHLMLKDAMLRLGISGYAVVALALRVKYAELINYRAVTIFALDDGAIFSGAGHAYITNFRFHVVPNRLLMAADLESLATGTVLPTMDSQRKLIITSAEGPTTPMSINYVKIKSTDMVYNLKIVVHALSSPFPDIHQTVAGDLGKIGRSGWEVTGSTVGVAAESNVDQMVAPTPVIESMVDIDDHHGL